MAKRKSKPSKHGAQNQIVGKVSKIQKGDIMSLIKFQILEPGQMAAVITTESLNGMQLAVGDKVELMVKAVHVLPVKL